MSRIFTIRKNESWRSFARNAKAKFRSKKANKAVGFHDWRPISKSHLDAEFEHRNIV
jgi:hypothetical protein